MKPVFIDVTVSFTRKHLADLQRLQNKFERTCEILNGTPRKFARLRDRSIHLGKLIEYREAIRDLTNPEA